MSKIWGAVQLEFWREAYSQLVTEALRVALSRRSKPPEIFHSDRGSEYRSKDLNEILIAKNIRSGLNER